ncbi:MAG: hypothetical protein IT450_08745 [Phycisphaerales bacterium]|nr:hypothetical protein [Phycisphaerales bacterium]
MRISSLTVPGKARDAEWAIAVEGHDASWRHVRVSLIDVMRRRRAAVVFDGVADSLEEGPPARPTVCASPGGKWCAIALPNGEVEIWNGQVFQHCVHDTNQPAALAGPAFRLPSSGGGARVIGGNWDVDDHPSGSACFVASISFAADEEQLALCRMDGTLEFWDLKNRSRRWAVAQPGPLKGRVCAISPDSKRVGVLTGDCVIQMFAAEDGRLLNQRQLANVSHVRRMVVFSPDDEWFIPLLHMNDIILYDAENLSEHRRLVGHNGAVRAVGFSADGTRLASGGADGLIKIWDVPTGQLVATLHGHELDVTWVGFLADGRTLISGGQDNTIRFWDSAPP